MGLSWALHSTLIYTSELIVCSTICVHSATRHNIHLYPYFLFPAIHHLNCPRLSLSLGRVTVGLIQRSWVQFPANSKEFLSYFFVKKIPLSRRVEYVVDGSMDQSVSQWVRDVCMSHQSDRIYYKQPIRILVLKVNGTWQDLIPIQFRTAIFINRAAVGVRGL